jgi:carbamoyltransferase
MVILGINGGVRLGYQDVSAVLLRDGEVLAAVEEERLTRVKHSPGQLPQLAVQEVLSLGGISIRDVDIIATHGSTWGEQYDEVLQRYFTHTFGHCPRIVRYHHHDCHAASAYFASGFDEAMVLTVDASGDGISLQRSIGRSGNLSLVERIPRENSLGILYAMLTQFCGFTRDTDEYKLMGLAPYGNADAVDLSFLLEKGNGSYRVNGDYLVQYAPGQPQGSRQQAVFNEKLIEKLGRPRLPGSAMDTRCMNIAASAQRLLEDALVEVVCEFAKETGLRKLSMAGGVALNCAANRKLLALDCIDELFIQPASGDAGISLGAAYLASAEFDRIPQPMTTAKLGRSYSESEVADSLGMLGLRYDEVLDHHLHASELLMRGNVVGWMEGRAEFGPRALGSRSIIASPGGADMKDRINRKVKFREGFRPFCPSVREEDFGKVFSSKMRLLPYMTVNVDVTADGYPAITHIDRTARVQTVAADDTSGFRQVLDAMHGATGMGMVVNTSFNRSREPMIYSPIDAVSAFFGSGLDALFIGPFLLRKK